MNGVTSDLEGAAGSGNRRPSLSIVVPVVDEEGAVRHALQALARWRASGAEVVVVDGGSADATVERCAGLADIVLRAPRGRARQMNAGAAASHGHVLLFLHVDTRLPDGAPELVEAALRRGSAAQWGRFDVAIEGRSRLFPVIAALMNARSAWTGIATGDQAIFALREAFEAAGGFPDQPLMEDIELSRRLKRRGRPARIRAAVVTSGRRWERYGVCRTIVLMWRLRLMYWFGTPAEKLARSYR